MAGNDFMADNAPMGFVSLKEMLCLCKSYHSLISSVVMEINSFCKLLKHSVKICRQEIIFGLLVKPGACKGCFAALIPTFIFQYCLIDYKSNCYAKKVASGC